MAITLVGTVTHSTPPGPSTGDVVALPAGVSEGDIVLAACSNDSAAVFPNASDGTDDYNVIVNTNAVVAYGVFYKVQGATPDATIVLPPWRSSGTIPTPWVVAVFRGVDAATPLDQTSVIASGGSGSPNPGSITTITDGAAVVSFGLLDDDVITSCAQSGATDVDFIGATDGSNASSTMFGWQTQVMAGAVDPAAFSTDGNDAWAAVTVALRPAAEGGEDALLVDEAQIVVDAQAVNLLSASILGVTASQIVAEGQAVTVASVLPVAAAEIVAEGGSVGIVSAALLPVVAVDVAADGQSVAFLSSDVLSVSAAGVAIQGQAVDFVLGGVVAVDGSEIAIAGQDVGLISAAILPVVVADVVVEGQGASFVSGGVLAVEAASIVVEGEGVALLSQNVLSVAAVNAVIEGQAVNLLDAIRLLVSASEIVDEGQLVQLNGGAVVTVSAAVVAVAGQAVDIFASASISVVAADVAFDGQVSFLAALRLVVASSEIVVSPSSVAVLGEQVVAVNRRPNIFGVNMASILGRALGPLTFDIVLSRQNQGGRDPANLAGGRVDYDGGSGLSWNCRGWVDQWTLYELQNSIIQAGDRKVVILGGTLQVDVVPMSSDIVTIEGEDLRIVNGGVKRDPAGATYTCQCRK